MQASKYSYLSHKGTSGMRWGYNDGRKNGKRTAGESEESEDRIIQYQDEDTVVYDNNYDKNNIFRKPIIDILYGDGTAQKKITETNKKISDFQNAYNESTTKKVFDSINKFMNTRLVDLLNRKSDSDK